MWFNNVQYPLDPDAYKTYWHGDTQSQIQSLDTQKLMNQINELQTQQANEEFMMKIISESQNSIMPGYIYAKPVKVEPEEPKNAKYGTDVILLGIGVVVFTIIQMLFPKNVIYSIAKAVSMIVFFKTIFSKEED